MDTAFINTPIGSCEICGDEHGISKILIHDSEQAESNSVPIHLKTAVNEFKNYFAGNHTAFTFKLNPSGTDFQKKIWQHLIEIPFGATTSYLKLSKKYGDPKAIRAVASANAKNPLWIVVPCHRVMGSDGSLTGYAGGLWRKKWLLEHENPTNQQTLF